MHYGHVHTWIGSWSQSCKNVIMLIKMTFERVNCIKFRPSLFLLLNFRVSELLKSNEWKLVQKLKVECTASPFFASTPSNLIGWIYCFVGQQIYYSDRTTKAIN